MDQRHNVADVKDVLGRAEIGDDVKLARQRRRIVQIEVVVRARVVEVDREIFAHTHLAIKRASRNRVRHSAIVKGLNGNRPSRDFGQGNRLKSAY